MHAENNISDDGDKNHGGHSVTVATDDDDDEDNGVLYPCPSVCQ